MDINAANMRYGIPEWWIASGLSLCIILWLALALAGCGGGAGGQTGTPPPPPPPSFSIVATPSAPSIAPGTSSTFQVSIAQQSGFSGAVAITISGLPSGLSAGDSAAESGLYHASQAAKLVRT
jgi:hypothetical protein